MLEDGTAIGWGQDGTGRVPVYGGASGAIAIDAISQHTVILTGTSDVTLGNQPVGIPSAPTVFTIRNTGESLLTIAGVSVSGDDSGDFLVNTSGMNTTLPAGGTSSFEVVFQPSGLGNRVTTLNVLSDDPDEGISRIGLSGFGLVFNATDLVVEQPPGNALISSSIVDFGEQPVGTNSALMTFTVINAGSLPLEISGVFVGEADRADFSIDPSGLADSVPGGGFASFGVYFNPTNLGARSATLRVVSNDPDENPFDIILTGTGTGNPSLTIEQPVGMPLIGTTSAAAWGHNGDGQANVPEGLNDLKQVVAGGAHNVALRNDGTVEAWGWNGGGQTIVPLGLSNVTAVAAGFAHSVALKADGTVAVWGNNAFGQRNVPPGLTGVTAIASGPDHIVALNTDGTIVGWGRGTEGQTNAPPGLSDVVALTAGEFHTLALKINGTLVAWGGNADGQTNTAGIDNVIAIASGGYHNLALKTDGTVLAWGRNTSGQTNLPPGVTDVVAIGAGREHSLAARRDGSVILWGLNNLGQTNPPTNVDRILTLDAGWFHNVALMGTSTIEFDGQGLESTSAAKVFTLKNTGNIPLNLGGIFTTGGEQDGFIVDTTGLQGIVPAGWVTNFAVFFSPMAQGLNATTLRVLSDDADHPILDFNLTGMGIPPVTSIAGSGSGSLREIIASAQAGDTIYFGAGLEGQTITLDGAEILIDKDLHLTALGLVDGVRISGTNASRVFRIASGVSVTLENLTLTGGQASLGGALHNSGTLVLNYVHLTGNTSTGRGGAVYNASTGTLTINQSTISDNTAADVGGGIVNEGQLTLNNSTVCGNTSLGSGGLQGFGGGIFNFNVPLTLTHSTIAGNTATTFGGGIRLQQGTVTLENTILAGNTASIGPDVAQASTTFIKLGLNFIGNNETISFEFPGAGEFVGTPGLPLDPMLASLGEFGGRTPTRPPLPGSAVINALVFGLPIDQRDVARPQGVNFDIGAVESISVSEGPTLAIEQAGGIITLSWDAVPSGIKVQSAPKANGPWTVLPNQDNPQFMVIDPGGPPLFFRLGP